MTHINRKIIITIDGEKGHSGKTTVEITENGKPKTRFEWTEATYTSLILMEIATDILCACHEDMMKHWMKYNHVPDVGKKVEQPEVDEDERIRDFLYELIKVCAWSAKQFPPREKCLAYLEKQKEQKHLPGFDELTPDEKMNHPLYLEGFDVGRKVGQVEAEQKPAEWSDDDEKMRRRAICACNFTIDRTFSETHYGEARDWLKSLPERFNLQPKQEWSEEEKRKLNRIYQILGWAADTHAYSTTRQLIGDKEAIELQDFLRSIVKPTINLAEWSDEENINTLIDVIKAYYNDFPINARGLVDWLKSLLSRPKSSDNLPKWKKASAGTKLPSESVIRAEGQDPRFGSVAVYDCEYITVNDIEKLPKED